MTRREVLEHLAHIWGVSDLTRLRRFTRDYLVYQERRGYRKPERSKRLANGV